MASHTPTDAPRLRAIWLVPIVVVPCLACPSLAQPNPGRPPTNRPIQIITHPAPTVIDAASDPYRPQPLPSADPATIAPYVDLLNEEDLAVRTSAADFILQTPTVALATITPYLTNPSLPPETRSRLLSIAELLFRVEPRAAMGIQFERAASLPVIIRSFPESPYFRAHTVLQAGDEIIEADGRVVESFDQFQGAILSHEPGETMHVKVRRRGEVIDAEVPLGDFMRLGLPSPPEPTLSAAWAIRLDRILTDHADQLTPALDCRSEADRESPTNDTDPSEPTTPQRQPLLVAASSGRGGVDQNGQFVEAVPIEVDELALRVRDMLRRQGLMGDALRQAEREVDALLARRVQMVAIRDRILAEIEAANLRLADPNLDLDTRRRLAEMLTRSHLNLGTAQSQIDLIDLQLPQRQ